MIALAVAVFAPITLLFAGFEGHYVGIGMMVLALALVVVGVFGEKVRAIDVGGVIFVLGGFYYWSITWHGIFYGMTVKQPGMIQWVVVGIIIMLFAVGIDLARGKENSASGVSLFFLGAVIAVVGFLFVGWFVGGIYAQEDMAHQVDQSVESMEELPEIDSERPRLLPEAVASKYGQNSLQTPRYSLEGGDITFINETPYWSYALAPDGGYNTWRLKQDGGVFVRMNTQDKDVEVRNGRFKYGDGQQVLDNYKWRVKRSDYWNDYRDPFVVPHEGELFMVVPYVDYNVKFKATPIPQLYSVPEFGGVKVIHEDGTIEDLSPQEAVDDPRLKGQNIYPYQLARFKVNSMRYQHGAINVWFTHKDQLQLASVPGQGNNQPFTTVTEDGITYFLAAEPWGENTHGVYQVWTVDSRTGDMKRKTYDRDSSLFGPAKATRLVRQEHPNFQWVSRGDSSTGNIEVSEPIPSVVDGTLYWQVFIVPDDSSAVARISYVNAGTGAVTTVETDEEANAFLVGREVVDTKSTQNRTQTGESTPALVITVENPDGTVDTITVPEGGSVTIQAPQNESVANAIATG